MKIYTKTGDSGETGLYRGGRVAKNSPRIEAYGNVDELNSLLGFARSFPLTDREDALLARVQNDLFVVGADLSTPSESVKENDRVMRLAAGSEEFMESAIDAFEAELEPLRQFILPGGTDVASVIHLARTVCRRAERSIVGLAGEAEINPAVIIYLNRLSDFLFVLARYRNFLSGKPDIPWQQNSQQ